MYSRISKILFPVVVLLACCFAFLFIRWGGYFQDMDLSLSPVFKKTLCQEPVYLASYADGDEIFMKNQNTLALSAINRGIDHIFLYRRSHMENDFLRKNKIILSEKKGAGLWLWKPYFILKTLDSMPPNGVLVYLDSGYVLSSPVDELIAQLGDKDLILITDDLDQERPVRTLAHCATLYSREKLACPEEAFYQGSAVMAASLVIRNTPFARKFVKEWLQACENEDLLKGYSSTPNDPNFQGSQEDQSLLGVLGAKYKKHVTFLSFHHPIKEKTISWHHRRVGASDISKSIIHQVQRASLRGFDRVVYKGLQWIHGF